MKFTLAVSFNSESGDSYLYLGHDTLDVMVAEIKEISDFAYLYVDNIETFSSEVFEIDEAHIRCVIANEIDLARLGEEGYE